MEASIINGLVSQAPGMVGVIIVVAYFLKSIEKRDSLFIDQMNKMTDRLSGIETRLTSHDEKSTNGHNAVMDGVKRAVRNWGRLLVSARPGINGIGNKWAF